MRTYTSPLTRSRLLTRLPVQSLRTHLFRKRLALGFYYEDSAYFTSSQNELVNLTDIVSRLKSPQFEITPATDYGELKNRLEILDIAVDDGPSKGIPGSQNKPIDDLVNTLKGMSMKIVDGSMTSLLRTEAKQAIESLQYRLTYSLERKGKREQSVLERLFMSEAEGERKKQGVLSLRKNG